MFLRDTIVKIRHGASDRFVQVESGPFKIHQRPGDFYQGWLLVRKGDPYGEPSTVCFVEQEAAPATPEEVKEHTNGLLNFREANF
jgi:hypothetical protein